MKTISLQFYPLSLQFTFSSTNPSIISFPYHYPSFSAFKTSNAVGRGGSGGFSAADLLRKPTAEPKDNGRGEDSWLDWEDRILEDTVPLVGFVRMILHSGKYESGERLSSEHESMILQRLLVHHPESDKKIGCGIDYIMERCNYLASYISGHKHKMFALLRVGHHPDFDSSRCLFIVRKNGEMVDFSYWKCIKGLIRKKYPLYADSFILQHFRRRKIID